jgi:hypothetical protein
MADPKAQTTEISPPATTPPTETSPPKQGIPKVQHKPFQVFQGTYCPTCDEKFLTDLTGRDFCPDDHPQCPRRIIDA